MWVHRMILDREIELARNPAGIIVSVVNEMRSNFTPVDLLDTRVFRHYSLPAICIQVSLPGSCCPQNPRGEVYA